jgi:hypothetical protein
MKISKLIVEKINNYPFCKFVLIYKNKTSRYAKAQNELTHQKNYFFNKETEYLVKFISI